MNVSQALQLLNQSLREHKLDSWTAGLDNSRARFGVCKIDKKHISLSRPLCELNDSTEVRDTILHEIAHALAWQRHGVNCGHDNRWKEICVEIGARPVACYDSEVVQPTAPWVLVHRDTGEVIRSYFKRPNRDWSTVWLRGRKTETFGMLEIRPNTASLHAPNTTEPAAPDNGPTVDMFAPDGGHRDTQEGGKESTKANTEVATQDSTTAQALASPATPKLRHFTAETVHDLREKLIAQLNEFATAEGLAFKPTKTRFGDQDCEFTVNFSFPIAHGVDPQRIAFEALAGVFGLKANDYMRPFEVNGREFRLIGFKLNNRKYPIIAIDHAGTKYKFEPAVLDWDFV